MIRSSLIILAIFAVTTMAGCQCGSTQTTDDTDAKAVADTVVVDTTMITDSDVQSQADAEEAAAEVLGEAAGTAATELGKIVTQ